MFISIKTHDSRNESSNIDDFENYSDGSDGGNDEVLHFFYTVDQKVVNINF